MWKGLFAAVLLALALAGCKMSNEALGREVMASMQETIDSDPQFSKHGLKYTNISVVQVQGNQYQGLATVTYEGAEHPVSVDITYDGETFMWSVKEGGFAFLAPVLFKDSYKQTQEQFVEAMRSLKEGLPPRNAATDITTAEWSVQVASHSDKASADELVRRLRAKDYNAYVLSVDGMNRVYVGPFNRPDAVGTQSRLMTLERLDGFVVRKRPD